MPQTEPAFTEDAYRKLRHRQDSDIKLEFDRQAEHFNEQLSAIKDALRHELGTLKDSIEETKARLNHLDGRSLNGSKILPRQPIVPVGIYLPNTGFTYPPYFPRTVHEFWKLQYQRNHKCLVSLLQFYQIEGYQQWSQTVDNLYDFDDSNESDNSSQEDLSLEEVVQKHPDVAMYELGSLLGLKVEKIQDFFDKAAYAKQEQLSAAKREAEMPASHGKRIKTSDPVPSEPQIPLSTLIALPIHSPQTPSTRGSELLWNTSEDRKRHKELVDKMEKDSTTDIIPSQESRDLGAHVDKMEENSTTYRIPSQESQDLSK